MAYGSVDRLIYVGGRLLHFGIFSFAGAYLGRSYCTVGKAFEILAVSKIKNSNECVSAVTLHTKNPPQKSSVYIISLSYTRSEVVTVYRCERGWLIIYPW